MRILKVYVEYKFTAQIKVTEVSRRWSLVGFIMLHLALVVCQFPAQYFGMLPGFNLLKLTRLSRVFTLFVSLFFSAGRNVKLYYVTSITNFDR